MSPLISGDYLVAAPGRVEPASEEIRVGAQITGSLKDVLVREGDQVHRNDIVARLENSAYEAALSKAEAELRLQEATLQRVLKGALPEEREATLAAAVEAEAVEKAAAAELQRRRKAKASDQAIEEAERDYAVARERHNAARQRYLLITKPAREEDVAIAKARVDVARAARAEAQAALEKTIIRSPIDGTILRVYRRPGELMTVFVDQPIMTVGDLSKLYVRAEIDEADIAKVEVGLPAYVTADAFGSKRFSGKVVRVGQTLGKKNVYTDEPNERTDTKVLEVLVELDSASRLPPGLRVNTFVTAPRVSARE
jgi:HlyD family secretion protein